MDRFNIQSGTSARFHDVIHDVETLIMVCWLQ